MPIRLTLLALFLASVSAGATTIEVIQPCAERIAMQSMTTGKTVAEATVTALTAAGIPFVGTSEGGISSILQTPIGVDAIEIISNQDMRAYGWCFEVDGVQPGAMPDRVSLHGAEHIKWFYGSALYKAGDWVSFCDPSSAQTPVELCGKPND